MNYLHRLIQRLSPNSPAQMLLPNAKGWNGLIDPFENTLFLAPDYPQAKQQQSVKHTEIAASPASLIEQTPLSMGQQASDSQRNATKSLPRELLPPKSTTDSVPQKEQQETPPQLVQKLDSQVKKKWSDQAVPNGRMETIREIQNYNLSPIHRPRSTRWETQWLRRYLIENPGLVETKQKKPGSAGFVENQSPLLPPRNSLELLTEENAATALIQPPQKAHEHRKLKRKQNQRPGLVIGQLTVDVVPVKPTGTSARRKSTAKNRTDNKRGKLTQAETVRIGFGIGQM